MDVDSLRPGVDYGHEIDSHVEGCAVMVALIGPRWLSAPTPDGARRLDDPEDWVRCEIGAALARDVRVIPVLVDGASMPAAGDLPEPLAGLARREALALNSGRAGQDVSKLVRAIIEGVRESGQHRGVIAQALRGRRRRLLAALAAALVAVAATVALLPARSSSGSLKDEEALARSVDQLLTRSREDRADVTRLVTSYGDGKPVAKDDVDAAWRIVAHRRALVSRTHDLSTPTTATRNVAEALERSVTLSLAVDRQIANCLALSSSADRVTCLSGTRAGSNDASHAKARFVTVYNAVRADLGKAPVVDDF